MTDFGVLTDYNIDAGIHEWKLILKHRILNDAPKYQRIDTATTSWRQSVISSILNDIPFPSFYFRRIHNGNFTVKEIAEAAQKAVPGSKLIFTGEHGGDSRTYKISFNKILKELRDYYKPKWDLDMGGRELVEFFDKIKFKEEQFRGRDTIRLQQLKYQIENDLIDQDFKYKTQ